MAAPVANDTPVPSRNISIGRYRTVSVLALVLYMTMIGIMLEEKHMAKIRRSVLAGNSFQQQALQLQQHVQGNEEEEEKETALQKVYDEAYSSVIEEAGQSCNRTLTNVWGRRTSCIPRKRIDFATFPFKSNGGLTLEDRQFLAELYYQSESAFEFGVGESTDIAAATNLPRYVGVDSSSEWITQVRERSPNRFRFHFADVGPTEEWGYPTVPSKKMLFNYQVAPLFLERNPFDVYLVDGRFRVACVMASFLHALHTSTDMNKTTVLLHDYYDTPENMKWRKYEVVETVATTEKRGRFLVMRLMPNVTENILYDIWKRYSEELK